MHFASMSLGIFDFLINWLTQFIIWVVGWIFELINTLLAQTWFQIGTSFANILDMLQGTFKKLCGMDVYWVGTERVEGVDPLLQMFTSSNVVQILIALTLVAVVMVIIAAIIQVIRIEFTTDMKYAVENLPETPRVGNSSTPTKWAAETCLADVYITMAGWPLKKGQEYYALAAEVAKDVLDNNGYHKQEANYEDLWKEANKNSSEFMFCLHHSHANKVMASNYGKSYYPVNFFDASSNTVRSGWADYYARKEAYLNYPDDKRKEWNFMAEWPSSEGEVVGTTSNGKPIYGTITWEESSDGLPCISKYYDYDQGYPGQNAQANGVTCIYRLADAKLLYAEASTRATGSVNSQAVEAVRSLQNRAGYAERGIPEVSTSVSADDFLNIVSNERNYEFYAEMRRWFELVRTEQVSVKRAETWNGSLFQTQNHYYFPIPSAQILLTGWTNNAGY